MTRWPRHRYLVGLSLLACAAVAAVTLQLPSRQVRAGDRNGDGRPDVWRIYDDQGRLSHVAVDSNFDGLADVQEYYEHGALVRRESDRNFNDRVDLVQDFDPATHEIQRAVTDVDFDGVADVLVLFQEGRPVFSKWEHRAIRSLVDHEPGLGAGRSARAPDGPLTPLEDPFRDALAVKAVRLASTDGDGVGLTTVAGIPVPVTDIFGPYVYSSNAWRGLTSSSLSATGNPYSPRGPPARLLLS